MRIKPKTPLQWRMHALNQVRNHNRSLQNSIVRPEVYELLTRWHEQMQSQFDNEIDSFLIDYVLVGNLAVSYHARPFNTQDIVILFTEQNASQTHVKKTAIEVFNKVYLDLIRQASDDEVNQNNTIKLYPLIAHELSLSTHQLELITTQAVL